MKAVTKKSLFTLVSVALLLLTATGSTLAYLFTATNPVENTFTPAQVSCTVVEKGTAYTANTVNLTSNNKTATIKNTSDVPAYIRAAIVVNWKKTDGTVYAVEPKSTDYTLTIGSDWTKNGGFYYYKSAVASNALTSELITQATQNVTAPAGYHLSIEIVAEAIQAEGMSASSAQEAWAKAAADS